MFLSVIVPVYNSEQYLERCLESVLAQSLGDYEVVLIDDGSTDASYELCCRFCSRDSRFRLVEHETNKGASAARNTGLCSVVGEYVMFLDNDDWIEGEDAFANLYDSLNRSGFPDVLCFPMGESYEPWEKVTVPTSNLENDVKRLETLQDTFLFMMENGMYYSSASGKIVKRSLIDENSLRFDESLKHNEDTEWSRRVLCCLESIGWTDSCFYVYRRNSAVSQSSRPDTEKVAEALSTIVNRHVSEVEKGLLFGYRATMASAFVSYIYVLLLSYLYMGKTDSFEKERAHHRCNSWLLDCGVDKRVLFVRRCCRIFGLGITGRLLAFAMKSEQKLLLCRGGGFCRGL